jgi:adenylate cyclase
VIGSTVNAASRLTSAARPGTVLVDAGVHEALGDGDDTDPDAPDAPEPGSEQEWRWRRVRRGPAKGFKHLEAWRVRPARE